MLRLVSRISAPRRVFAVPTGGKDVRIARSAALRPCWKSQQARSYHGSPARSASSEPPGIQPRYREHRIITTFSPQKLVAMNQRIFNISGFVRVHISPRGGGTVDSRIRYVAAKSQGGRSDIPFPDDTTGAFYYRQSNTSPTRIGELRFRLCSNLQTFDMGNDLLLPSGQPWFISSQSLHLTSKYKSVREHLVEEGLLEHDLYPGVPDSLQASGIIPLTSIGQPFVVDLSASSSSFQLVSPGSQAASLEIQLRWLFRRHCDPKQSLFSGRAVVCLEQNPPSATRPMCPDPLFSLRVLEFLTPMKRLSASNGILDPIPGQLLMHRYRKSRHDYVPWGYSSTKADTRTAVTDWIRAQSVSPQL
ncbi:hypothetical protein D9619_011524 [Psilocybe cf. subviscida]|uniref:Uncharacterized protein n=1 Tax=Psilocybe cf. subviscida TaxID=2480587 RepID=A0A8H5BSL1_9AGAR|nr:hypothetical protein D9619_011524 [Psilocybe cf. subviscida]